MYAHAPNNYICPICLAIKGIENNQTMIKQADLVYNNKLVSVYINSKFYKNNKGHCIVVPNKHFENIYVIDSEVLAEVARVAKLVSIAMKKAYKCFGINLMQNNEPMAGQHAMHFHLHIIPRYKNDNWANNILETYISKPSERIEYVKKLKEFL
jgi:histidine triad (HIT) family protein